MKMDNDTMRMRQIQALDLPAGQLVKLAPGGYHLMLLNLKQPLGRRQSPADAGIEDARRCAARWKWKRRSSRSTRHTDPLPVSPPNVIVSMWRTISSAILLNFCRYSTAGSQVRA
jgi:hypothetical protein